MRVSTEEMGDPCVYLSKETSCPCLCVSAFLSSRSVRYCYPMGIYAVSDTFGVLQYSNALIRVLYWSGSGGLSYSTVYYRTVL